MDSNFLNTLKTRLAVYWESSITGALLILYATLSDYGVSLSDLNKGQITAKVVAFLAGIWNIFRKEKTKDEGDGGGSGTGTGTTMNPRYSFLLVLLACTVGLAGCWFKGKTNQHKAALAVGNATVAQAAGVDIVELLETKGQADPAWAKGFYSRNKKINDALDVFRKRVQAGYNRKDLVGLAPEILKDIAAIEDTGVTGIKNEDTRAAFQDYVFAFGFAAETLRDIIDLEKEPKAFPEEKARSIRTSNSRQISGIVGQIASIVREAYFSMWRQSRLDLPGVLADGFARAGVLREKLAQLSPDAPAQGK